MIQVGDLIPKDISVKNQKGEGVRLSDYLNDEYLVIYFYPKDNTSGCTKEACSFRDNDDELKKLGARVIGISKDSADSHVKFIDKNSLNFDLLADEDLELNKAFGVWVEKSMYGKKYMGTQRATFIANKNGEIVKVWETVKPVGHAEEVLQFIKDLS